MFDTNNSTVCWFLWFWYPAFTLDPRSFLFFLEGSYTSSSWIGCLDVEEMKCVVPSTLGFTKRVRFGSLTSWITYIVPKFLIYARKIITKPHFFALRSYNSTTHNLRYWSEAYIFLAYTINIAIICLYPTGCFRMSNRESANLFFYGRNNVSRMTTL